MASDLPDQNRQPKNEEAQGAHPVDQALPRRATLPPILTATPPCLPVYLYLTARVFVRLARLSLLCLAACFMRADYASPFSLSCPRKLQPTKKVNVTFSGFLQKGKTTSSNSFFTLALLSLLLFRETSSSIFFTLVRVHSPGRLLSLS
ncbi:hypothetical protein TRV_03678 [Trichophyton verrucosum HKI 0517]|uniref:Uncharacterized protein n=1 Tax=Trichophyton verrucosum (strain HKI 0517) TaxID=663202 RepID=D4D987_TRIVH|nr:uncharacterized protein TRV_03678 [Trichophyton verrucosum HKI 0517]EFE41579.1 hypothetical protein TRV_03678 [Trichophyton verrucosum HKI 0517]